MGPLTYKVFNLYSFIRCGTYNSHLYTNTPLQVWVHLFSMLPLQTDWYYLYRRCCFLRKRTGCLGRTLRRTGLWYHRWVIEGRFGGTVHIEARTATQARENHTLTQNLKVMDLWVLLLIRCSTFILLSDVRHITHSCTQQQTLLINCVL